MKKGLAFEIYLPLYPVNIYVSMGQSDKQYKSFKEKNEIPDCSYLNYMVLKNEQSGGVSQWGSTIAMRLIDIPETNHAVSLLVHELFHVAEAIGEHIGLEMSDSSSEAYAYLIQYLTKEVFDAIQRYEKSISVAEAENIEGVEEAISEELANMRERFPVLLKRNEELERKSEDYGSGLVYYKRALEDIADRHGGEVKKDVIAFLEGRKTDEKTFKTKEMYEGNLTTHPDHLNKRGLFYREQVNILKSEKEYLRGGLERIRDQFHNEASSIADIYLNRLTMQENTDRVRNVKEGSKEVMKEISDFPLTTEECFPSKD